MADTDNAAPNPGGGGGSSGEDIPMMQALLDNPFLLLALGIISPTVLYIIWGVVEVAAIPLAN